MADLSIVSPNYLGPFELRNAAEPLSNDKGLAWALYLLLTRSPKLALVYESKGGRLPAGKFFSPHFYVISRVP